VFYRVVETCVHTRVCAFASDKQAELFSRICIDNKVALGVFVQSTSHLPGLATRHSRGLVRLEQYSLPLLLRLPISLKSVWKTERYERPAMKVRENTEKNRADNLSIPSPHERCLRETRRNVAASSLNNFVTVYESRIQGDTMPRGTRLSASFQEAFLSEAFLPARIASVP